MINSGVGSLAFGRTPQSSLAYMGVNDAGQSRYMKGVNWRVDFGVKKRSGSRDVNTHNCWYMGCAITDQQGSGQTVQMRGYCVQKQGSSVLEVGEATS